VVRDMAKLAKLIGLFCWLGLAFAAPLHAQPPHHPKVAFCAWGPMGFDLGISDANGKVKMLTENHFALFPYFSPDGQSLFFCQRAESKFGRVSQIYRFDLQDQQIVRISDGSAIDEYPICSPDGKHLAFISRPGDPKLKSYGYHIYIMDTAGKNRQAMKLGDDVPQLYPSWSPDGNKIVYCHLKLPWSGLKIYDLQKKTTVKLVPFYFYPMEAAWSPNGDEIAFTSWNPLTSTYCLWVVKPDGSDCRQLTEGPADRQPSWFPDGRRLIFTRKDGEQNGLEQRGIYVIDLKTRKITRAISIKDYRFLYPRVSLAH